MNEGRGMRWRLDLLSKYLTEYLTAYPNPAGCVALPIYTSYLAGLHQLSYP